MDDISLKHRKQSGKHATKASKTMTELIEIYKDH